MARYRGPKWKISRRENSDVYGNDKWKKRAYPPGVHTLSKGRPSQYAIQFREKQKVKRMYGLLEKQFRNIYKSASKSTGNTGTRLLQLLELRLDNVVYRLGFAKSRNQARQFIKHGHIYLNGKKVNLPSVTCKPKDIIEYSPKFLKNPVSKIILAENKTLKRQAWLSKGQVLSEPTRDMIDPGIRERMIVELYSR